MYSNKENVNILTALLVAHGVKRAVVSPGSRNAPIVHNLYECPHISCYPVTDERSAGFFAIGLIQMLQEPVAVCVTSGTALLNLYPAVAEARYQHLPLIVISADRQQQWIDQLDGQTLPQTSALGSFVRRAVTIAEPSSGEQHWYVNRLVNEALLAAVRDDNCCPVHINVPLGEPLFCFDVPTLPAERKISRYRPSADCDLLPVALVDGLAAARKPMIVFGQTSPNDFSANTSDFLFSHVIVLHESLSPFPHVSHFDEVLARIMSSEVDNNVADDMLPDFIIHVGDTIVSKRLRQFLRRAAGPTYDHSIPERHKRAITWRISASGDVEDTFMSLGGIVVGDAETLLQSLSSKLRNATMNGMAYRRKWLGLLTEARRHARDFMPPYSQMAAVKAFEYQLSQMPREHLVCHYANSSAIRLANIYAEHHVWCNRGVNGIEGSLSTAAGASVVHPTVCVIGDLSFFYDQNALWNTNITGNLRILLLNNFGGAIFHSLPGLSQSSAAQQLVAAQHNTNAEGICSQNNILYRKVQCAAELDEAMRWLLFTQSSRPVLLEVITQADADTKALTDYIQSLK